MKTPRFVLSVIAAALLVALSAGAVLGGEITGNGKLLDVKGRSECAFSGQEDLQWFTDDFQTERKEVATKGDPGRAQSWGQIPKAVRDEISPFAHPSLACNPTKANAAH